MPGQEYRSFAERSPVAAQYALSIAAVAAALTVNWLLNPLLGDIAASITVLGTLMPLALLVRTGPYLAAGSVGLLGVLYFFIPPPLSFRIEGPDAAAHFVLLAFAAAVIGLTAWLIRRAHQRRQSALRLILGQQTAVLDKTNERLRAASRMAAIGKLATALAHDLSNAILPLRVHTEELASVPSAKKENVDAVLKMLSYLSTLSAGLRLLAQDPDRARADSTDLYSWQPEAMALFRAVVPRRISLDCTVDPGLPRIAVGPSGLTQAVLNLVTNASDAITQGKGGRGSGRIEIRVSADPPDQDTIRLVVRDDGPGMEPAVLAHCRERFFTTKATGAGLGLGLSIVTGVADAAGGSTEIDSSPGQGTTVTLHFRRADETRAVAVTGRVRTMVESSPSSGR